MTAQAEPGDSMAQGRIDEEDVRLTTGFADIFTAILLVVGGTILGAISGFLVVAAAFALGKPLIRTRGFAACGNVLAVGTAVGAAFGTAIATLTPFGSVMPFATAIGVWGMIPATICSALYWRTYRVPLALSLAWIAAVGLVFNFSGNLLDFEDLFRSGGGSVNLLAGGALFAIAMWYDSRDRLRQTRMNQVAFWLHLASAPLFVHGLFSVLKADPFSGSGVDPAVVLSTFFVLTLASLAIDRRPLLASSFVYLVAATGTLLRDAYQTTSIGELELQAAMAPAVIGVMLMALAAGWGPLRRAILMLLPDAMGRYLPPPALGPLPAIDLPGELPVAEKEPVRLVLGFNDLFVALGALALFVGSIFIGVQLALFMSPIDPFDVRYARGPDVAATFLRLAWLPIVLPALAMWLVAEYFVRVRRMAWPAITSALAFSLIAGIAGVVLAMDYGFANRANLIAPAIPYSMDGRLEPAVALRCVLLACLMAVGANLLFWLRHQVPISFTLAVAALLPLAFIDSIVARLSTGFGSDAGPIINWQMRLVLAGLCVFTLAMAWDRSDPARTTKRADNAFWLHLLASALVIPMLYFAASELPGRNWLIAAGFAGITALALAIDRRVPLVVALPFALEVVNRLMGPGVGVMFASLALLIALLVLVLRWDQMRDRLLGLFARPA